MTVLVTGAAGFIGSHVCERAVDAGWRVVGVDNFDPFYERDLKERNLAALSTVRRFELVEADIRDGPRLQRLFRSHGPFRAVVHLAARAGVRASIADPVGYVDTNVRGTVALLEQAVRQRQPPRFLFASSSSVYGDRAEVPFRESDRTAAPASPYAATKLAGELLCRAYHHVHGLPVFCLRLFTVYGPRQRPDLALHKFTRLLLTGEPVPLFGDGSASRDYTYVDDAAAGILAAVERCRGYEIVNLGSGRPIRLGDVIAAVGRACGRDPRVVRLPPQRGDVQHTFADISKASDLLGYVPRFDFEQGLSRQVRWLREALGPRAA